jgi:hypothetical protein
MISKRELVSMVRESANPVGAATDIKKLLGLADKNGRGYKDAFGKAVLKTEEAELKPEEFSLKAVAEAFLGEDFANNPDGGLKESAGVGAVTPSNFANISGFTIAVGGLIEYKILEAFQNPDFIAERLAETVPTSILGENKFIGIANVGDLATERKPGEAVKMTGLEDRWVQTPATVEHSLGMEITFEAIAQDLTQQILTRAASVGHSVGIRKELRLIDTILGVTNTYSYKGTSYNTYQAATPWINTAANDLVDWTDVNIILQYFNKMRDPETGLPILVNPTDLLVMPAQLMTATKIFRDTSVQARTPTTMAVVSGLNNPVAGMFNPMTSNFLYYRATAADGLNLSESDANEVHIMGDFKKALGYKQFHPLQVEMAIPGTLEMLSRRIVSAYFAYERGVPFVKEPRFLFKATNAG